MNKAEANAQPLAATEIAVGEQTLDEASYAAAGLGAVGLPNAKAAGVHDATVGAHTTLSNSDAAQTLTDDRSWREAGNAPRLLVNLSESSDECGDDTAELTILRGRYIQGDELARGNMGYVQTASDVGIGRAVAIKHIHPHLLSNHTNFTRFVHESQLTGQLEHPSIVPVYDIGLDEKGKPFYVMRLVSGKTLAEILDGMRSKDAEVTRRFTWRRLLGVLHQVCTAVGFAHAKGVVHRDLKPANIMLGEHGEVYVMDWGIAKVLEPVQLDAQSAAELRAFEGDIVGTPAYMSPEQASGRGDAVGTASDVFALGTILYEILTLTSPFAAPDLRSVLYNVVHLQPQPPRQMAPNAGIMPTLELICLTALAKHPLQRYADANGLAEELMEEMEGLKGAEFKRTLALAEHDRAVQTLHQHGELQRRAVALDLEVEQRSRTLAFVSAAADREALAGSRAQRDIAEVLLGKAFSDASQQLETLLRLDPTDDWARASLNRLYREKAAHCDRIGDLSGQLFYDMRVLDVEPPQVGGQAFGSVFIRTDPAGAEVFLIPFDELEHMPACISDHDLGRAPAVVAKCPPGGYVAIGRFPGYEDKLVPIVVEPDKYTRSLLLLRPLSASASMVGRETTMARIAQTVDEVVKNSRQAVLALRGPSGWGVTRLFTEVRSHVEDSPVLFFYCGPSRCVARYRHVPYTLIRAWLCFRFGLTDGAVVEEGGQGIEPWRAGNADREIFQSLLQIPGLLGPVAQHTADIEKAQQVFTAFLQKHAQRSAVMLGIQAPHFLDDASFALVDHALAATHNAPVFALIAPVDRVIAEQPRFASFFDYAHAQIAQPLAEHDVRQLLERALGNSVDPDVVRRMHAATDGSPRWLIEAVRVLANLGALRVQAGVWQLDPRIDAEHFLPEALARQRIQAWSGKELAVLQAAAVAGSPFGRDELAALGVTDVEDAIRLLNADGAFVASDMLAGNFEFGYEQLADAVLATVSEYQQFAQHLLLAEYLAQRSGFDPARQANVAHHYAAAQRWVEAAHWADAMAMNCQQIGVPSEAAWWHNHAQTLRATDAANKGGG